MDKAIIIGCPGSGKSVFGRKLNCITGLPLYHLDMMYWNEDRTTVAKEVFLDRLRAVMSSSKWIIDGNYGGSMEMRFKECDTVFFLDYPTEVCIQGVESRKGKPRSDMPWIENENTDEDFIDFINNGNRNFNICCLTLHSAKWLMNHNFTVRKRITLALSTG